MVKIEKIDINTWIDGSNLTLAENNSTIGRRIWSLFIKTSNELSLETRQLYINVVVGYELIDYVLDLGGFNYCIPTPEHNDVELIGILGSINIFIDKTNTLLKNEYLVFRDMEDIKFLKKINRTKKLERILKNEW
jgi:hypothetical protein